MEKMTDTLLEQAARDALSGRGTLLPAVAETNDGMGLFEASQGGLNLAKLKQAQGAARLMKKAGTKAADAKARLQKKFGLSDRELKSVLVSVWGLSAKNEGVEDTEANLEEAKKFKSGDELLDAALKKVDSKSIRDWASNAHNRPIWVKLANAALKKAGPSANVETFAAYIVSVALG